MDRVEGAWNRFVSAVESKRTSASNAIRQAAAAHPSTMMPPSVMGATGGILSAARVFRKRSSSSSSDEQQHHRAATVRRLARIEDELGKLGEKFEYVRFALNKSLQKVK